MARKPTIKGQQSDGSRAQDTFSTPSRLDDGSGTHGIFSREEIAERAYQLFEREGRTDGRDMEHWLQAERELRVERERNPGAAGSDRQQVLPRSARQHQRQGA